MSLVCPVGPEANLLAPVGPEHCGRLVVRQWGCLYSAQLCVRGGSLRWSVLSVNWVYFGGGLLRGVHHARCGFCDYDSFRSDVLVVLARSFPLIFFLLSLFLSFLRWTTPF